MTQAKITKPRCDPVNLAKIEKFAKEMENNPINHEPVVEETYLDFITNCFCCL